MRRGPAGPYLWLEAHIRYDAVRGRYDLDDHPEKVPHSRVLSTARAKFVTLLRLDESLSRSPGINPA
jgi:hypothetical protein